MIPTLLESHARTCLGASARALYRARLIIASPEGPCGTGSVDPREKHVAVTAHLRGVL